MKKIKFTKMVASGNDFIIIDRLPFTVYRLASLAKVICQRKYGVGADGLIVLEKSKLAAFKMRIFNPDGSQAKMCGNGARCAALYIGKRRVAMETQAGIIQAAVNADSVKIKLTAPKDLKLNKPVKINMRTINVNFIDTGVPHAVIFVEGLEKIDVVNLGARIRYHKNFAPKGTNVDFVEVLNNSNIKVRTYERGVEEETLACGTGAVAASLISNIQYPISNMRGVQRVNVQTKSGEILKVYFVQINNKFQNVWLEGKARIVYRGEICLTAQL